MHNPRIEASDANICNLAASFLDLFCDAKANDSALQFIHHCEAQYVPLQRSPGLRSENLNLS